MEILGLHGAIATVSGKQLLFGSFTDGYNRWMLEFALHRKGIEANTNLLGFADLSKAIASELRFDDGGGCEYSEAFLREGAQERKILEFSDNDGANVVGDQPLIQASPECAVICWNQERDSVDAFWETSALKLYALRREESNSTLAE
jgi:hypothetical protein